VKKSSASSSIIQISKQEAAQFLLAYHFLFPPRAREGKKGILEIFKRLGCVQFDPINIVGRNPELVLQARVKDYHPELLDELLYSDHRLMDCWDKVSGIARVEDYPYFARHRQRMRERFTDENKTEIRTAVELLELIRTEGEFDLTQPRNKEMIVWDWGRPIRMERAALEILYAMGKVGIARRVGSRRSFDLIERLVCKSILDSPDPNQTLEEYHDWHVYRRLGGMGLAQLSAAEAWLGIHLMKTPERKASLERLKVKKIILQVEIDGLPGKTFFMRKKDLPFLENPLPVSKKQATFLAPLDNLLWDRNLISMIFGFDYTWEIYKKPHQRKYGHYTLPVLYDDRFIARFDPVMDRKNSHLLIRNWWWEEGVRSGKEVQKALSDAIKAFKVYLGADNLSLTVDVKSKQGMKWLERI
jgi:uncharacterized protein